jgi:signal transduction histidine kinase
MTLVYYLSGKLIFIISDNLINHMIVSIVIFLPEGFSLAGAIIFGRKVWLGVFMGQLFLALNQELPFQTAVLISTVNALEVIIVVYSLEYLNLDRRFLKLKDTIGLILIVLLVAQPFSALFGNITLLYSSIITEQDFIKSLFSWWFGNTMAQLLVAPMLIYLYADYKRIDFKTLLFTFLLFSFLSYLLFFTNYINSLSLLLSITTPIVLLISIYRDIIYATIAITTISLFATYATNQGFGVFVTGSELDNVININFYIVTHIFLVLIVGILFLEKKENEEIILRQNRELESMMLKQSRLAQMGEILNMVAHQWRQPLTNLLLINEILVYRYREGEINDEEIDEFQKESTFQIKQMSKTIDDFKDFFHPRKEKVKFSLNDVVENLLYIIKPIFRESNIHININKEENLYLYGYPNEMSQALLNLLYNSKDAFIERDIKERYINIVLEKKQNQILLIVQDNAGGIPKDIIENIFKPYFSTKNNQGTGLGLSISKIIIEKHMEGSLFVENIKEGTAFIMRFKLKE